MRLVSKTTRQTGVAQARRGRGVTVLRARAQGGAYVHMHEGTGEESGRGVVVPGRRAVARRLLPTSAPQPAPYRSHLPLAGARACPCQVTMCAMCAGYDPARYLQYFETVREACDKMSNCRRGLGGWGQGPSPCVGLYAAGSARFQPHRPNTGGRPQPRAGPRHAHAAHPPPQKGDDGAGDARRHGRLADPQ